MTLILTYIMAGITLAGSVFNAKKLRIGFALWGVTNFWWISYNIMIGEYAQSVVYVANFCISVYGFVKWATPYKEIDKFYVRKDQGLVTWVYYNPDSDSGGQYVLNEFDYSLIQVVDSNSYDADGFFDCLDGYSKQYLVDRGTEDFKHTDKEHRKRKADFVDCTADTMMGLILLARDDASKGMPEGCMGFKPEKDNGYPLCDRPDCDWASTCNKSAHMLEPT